jgi:hypothetical protein
LTSSAGLGQDHGRPGEGEAGDVPETGKAELAAQDGAHLGFGGLQLGAEPAQVAELAGDPAEQAAP